MRVFMSHIHEEAAFALVLKDWIESTFGDGCDVFLSSDNDDLPAGSRWLEEVDGALSESVAVVTICSPSSVMRPWINFETGCAWIKRTPVIPICHSGLTRETLPQPLSRFQALDFSPDMPRKLLEAIAKYLSVGILPRIAWDTMYNELRDALAETSSKSSSAITVSNDQLDETEERILLVLAEAHHPIQEEQLSRHFDLKPAKLKYYLERLADHDLVYAYFSMNAPARYTIGRHGRAYLVSRGLL
jgi:hypothetical protein